ncbi:hypothetical protein [Microbacterium aurum]
MDVDLGLEDRHETCGQDVLGDPDLLSHGQLGTAVEIDPPHEEWIWRAAAQHGFTVSHHVLEIFGRCAECAADEGIGDGPWLRLRRAVDHPAHRASRGWPRVLSRGIAIVACA